ncbi:MAG: CapA family protein [Deltaproteobacteria bacterium]|nr:CapA family protein [Deltaproteobacteria bacterium]
MNRNSLAYLVCLCIFYLTAPAISNGDDDVITIVAVGDIYLGGSASSYLKQRGYAYPFESTKNTLNSADIVVVNLEAPLTNRTETFMNKEFVLKANPDAAEAIKTAGFDVATLANNHIMDYGPEGLKDTINSLNKEGISYTGAGEDLSKARKPAILNVKNKKIAFLAYSKVFPEEFYATNDSSGTAPGLFEYVRHDIKKAKQHADIIIVSFHWGEELLKYPKEYQIKLAHLAIDSGANLIIGHHPHVIQGIERYRGGLIFYSLGNFVFGSIGQSMPEGMIVIVRFNSDKIISAEIIPLNVNNKEVLFQPKPLQGEKAEAVIKNIQEISDRFKLNIMAKEGKGYIQLGEELKSASLP